MAVYNISKVNVGDIISPTTYSLIVDGIRAEQTRRGQALASLTTPSKDQVVSSTYINSLSSVIQQWTGTTRTTAVGDLITASTVNGIIDDLNTAGAVTLWTPWDSGVVAVSPEHQTSIYPPAALTNQSNASYFISHYGGWGQSAEDGQINIYNSSGTLIGMLREGAAVSLPFGLKLYSVAANGTETNISVFPDQWQTAHYVYLEIFNMPTVYRFESSGDTPHVSNPTQFVSMRCQSIDPGTYPYSGRASTLASLGTYGRYFVIK
jgi:hypothetical protein